jgi:hypothetical protein
MNQKVAKRLRKEVYGNVKQETTYSKQYRKNDEKKLVATGGIICNNPRREYLDKKKNYKN